MNEINKTSLLGYSNKMTVRLSEGIEFKINAEQDIPYVAQLVRLIGGTPDTGLTSATEEISAPINGQYTGREQAVVPGSCVIISDSTPLNNLEEFTLLVTLMPTTPVFNQQYVIGRWDEIEGRGWSLLITPEGRLAFSTTDAQQQTSTVALEQQLKAKHWYQAAIQVSWVKKKMTLTCIPLAPTATHQMLVDTSCESVEMVSDQPNLCIPLIMAAAYGGEDSSGRVIPVGCFNGRLEAPVIYRGLLSKADLVRVLSGDRPLSLSHDLIADWDFGQGIGSTHIEDCSPNNLHGQTHNLPSRAVKGSRWNGTSMDYNHAPGHYAAIHFHSDDLYDCGWQTDIHYQVNENLRSGIYALRLRQPCVEEGTITEEYIPFFVAPPKGNPQAKVAFIIPTHTYLAYGNISIFEKNRLKFEAENEDFYGDSIEGKNLQEYSELLAKNANLGCSTYDRHIDGSPVEYSSSLRPLLNIRPTKSILLSLDTDLLFVEWLGKNNIEYDIITDDLLHDEGVRVLNNYKVAISGCHPEYVTTDHREAIEAYLAQGGRFMYMGGNGYYWRSAVHKTLPGVIEVRRGRSGTVTSTSEYAEDYLEFTGEMGGLWRDLGRPPQQLVGVGFISVDAGVSSYYQVHPEAKTGRTAFIFEGVNDEIVGDFGTIGGGAAGFEIDRSNSNYGTPEHAVILAHSSNHNLKSTNLALEERALDDSMTEEYFLSQAYGELVFFETPNGGAVFSVGSMAWFGCLSHNNYDNNISTITANVLNRFIDSDHFELLL